MLFCTQYRVGRCRGILQSRQPPWIKIKATKSSVFYHMLIYLLQAFLAYYILANQRIFLQFLGKGQAVPEPLNRKMCPNLISTAINIHFCQLSSSQTPSHLSNFSCMCTLLEYNKEFPHALRVIVSSLTNLLCKHQWQKNPIFFYKFIDKIIQINYACLIGFDFFPTLNRFVKHYPEP